MKYSILILLCLTLLLSLSACQADKQSFQQPVQLYYRTVAAENGICETVIGAVTVEGAGKIQDPQALLNDYLKGTREDGLLTTFPASTKLLSMEISDGTASLMLNASLARLSGAELTVACACIARTTMELTGVHTVRIRASDSTLNGAEEILMTADNLLLEDQYTIP